DEDGPPTLRPFHEGQVSDGTVMHAELKIRACKTHTHTHTRTHTLSHNQSLTRTHTLFLSVLFLILPFLSLCLSSRSLDCAPPSLFPSVTRSLSCCVFSAPKLQLFKFRSCLRDTSESECIRLCVCLRECVCVCV